MQQWETLNFLREVTTVQPGLDGKKRDLIAARLNKIFYATDSDLTSYPFYDGEQSHSLFTLW